MLREHIVAFHDKDLNIYYIVDSHMLHAMLRVYVHGLWWHHL